MFSSNVPWKLIFSRPEVWAILVNQFCNSWGTYVLISWLPSYYNDVYKVDINEIGYFTVLPYICQGIMGVIVGWLGDFAIKKGVRVLRVRQFAQCVGMLGPALFLVLAAYVGTTPEVGMAFITLGLTLNSLTFIGVSINQLDIAPSYAGVIFGLGNTAGCIPGIVGVYLTGWMLDVTNRSWSAVFTTAAGVYTFGAIVWLFLAGDKVVIR
eukprot:Colp12_sorted_trinity150504_noHs@24495